ncbi:MAG: hypothetical protein NTY68_01460 [Candidatus Micrarchaeota archaeon]|nr:hypothetical protein [Candidatus Micrarchaeota archaeon]
MADYTKIKPAKADPINEFKGFLENSKLESKDSKKLIDRASKMNPDVQKVFVGTLKDMTDAGMKANARNIGCWADIVEKTNFSYSAYFYMWKIDIDTKKADYNLMNLVRQQVESFNSKNGSKDVLNLITADSEGFVGFHWGEKGSYHFN